jgi:hypothetical protein
MSDAETKRFLVKRAWWQVGFFLLLAVIATCFRGFAPGVLLGWLVLLLLCALTLCIAYEVRKAFLGAWKDYEKHGGIPHEQFWDEVAKEVK